MTTNHFNDYHDQTSNNSDVNGQRSEDDRKLFVGGLTWDTTKDDLREYFAKFGNILDCSIKHDPTTGRSRGFAFLVFDRKDIVDKILSQNEHFVKGRKVDPKPAHRRLTATNNINNNNSNNNSNLSVSSTNSNNSNNNRKVFIGGLDPNFPDIQLREYFSKYGTIDEIDLPFDKEKNERRPFCFISFQNEQSAQEVLRLQRHTIGDISVDVKRAKPKTSNNQHHHQHHHQQQQQQQYQHTHQQLYDPYRQQNVYASYNTGVQPYGINTYSNADPYAAWNGYSYNPQASHGAHPYAIQDASSIPNSGTPPYQQYSQAQSNSQYPYLLSNPTNTNEYYPPYAYGNPHGAPNPYVDSNAYAGAYDYNICYAPGGAPMIGSVGDNGLGQQGNNSPIDTNNYEHGKNCEKSKTSIVPSPACHTYSIS